ncbi:MAG: Serine/threonine protein kinase [Candidatus Saccharibacteria bacterium]|nr:Serine/threonine protein kinase [Candidatus Saccharibacteria bacterium]
MNKMLQTGEVVHHYVVVAPKGDGTYGAVFEVQDTTTNALNVALKILTATSPIADTRFRAENGHLHTLKGHDSVISPTTHVLDIGGKTFYCMELADTNVDKYISSKALGNDEAIGIFKNVCEGLSHAHNNGIVHRDLHLGNVLLMTADPAQASPRVTDFGMAKDFNGMNISSIPASVWGAVEIRPPEIFFMLWPTAELEEYIRSDIYALGILLHNLFDVRPTAYLFGLINSVVSHLWSKGVLVDGQTFQIDPTVDDVSRKQFYDEWLSIYDRTNQDKLAVTLREPNPALEVEVNRIIQKCCEPDYNDRYMTVDELLTDVSAIC